MESPKVLTAAEVAEIRAREEKTTPGPWGFDLNHTIAAIRDHDWDESVLQLPWVTRGKEPTDREKQNAEFAAHSRADVPALCDTVDALRADNTRLKGLIEGMWHEAQCKSFHCRCIEGSNRVACTNQACCSCIRGKVNA